MKQKQVKASAKVVRQTKSASRSKLPKNTQVVAEESDNDEEEEVVPEKVVAKRTVNKKKPAKGKKVVEEIDDDEQVDVDEADEDSDEEEEAVQAKVVAKKQTNNRKAAIKKTVVEEPEDDEQDEDEDEAEYNEEEISDEDNDEEMEDEEIGDEDNDEEDDDVCPPPSEILVGPFKIDYDPNQCVHVTGLPIKCKQIDIVEAFAKYGAIKQIHIVTTPSGSTADIAFKTTKAAAAAIADDKKVQFGDIVVSVGKKETKVKKDFMRERSVVVKNIKKGTTEKDLRELFEPCGEIDFVKLIDIHPLHAFVTFTSKVAVLEALKLHNTILNDSNIQLFENSKQREERKKYSENLTIMLKNKQEFESIDVSKLESIFSKCGEIDFMDVICKKNILAFIVFKTEDATENALKMNGQTLQDIILDIDRYGQFSKKWTSIHVANIPKACTEEDLRTHFAKAGEIANVILKGAFAIIRFEDSDGYCKSFLYNESFLKGHMIFIEPHSKRKAQILRKNYGKNKGFKRSFENGHGAFKSKKPKTH